MKKNEKNRLVKLPKEVKALIAQGCYLLFTFDNEESNFLLVTDRGDRFLLNWEGNVLKQATDTSTENSKRVVFPFPEISDDLSLFLNSRFG